MFEPVLPQSVSIACSANRITSFPFGTTNTNFPRRAEIFTERLQTRLVGGADGSFHLLGARATFDAYYTHGENRVDIDNMILRALGERGQDQPELHHLPDRLLSCSRLRSNRSSRVAAADFAAGSSMIPDRES